MKYPRPLKTGKFLKRYKRFFADIEFEGEVLTAHVPNTGSMKGCSDMGSDCLFSSHDDPNRKLKYTLEAVRTNSTTWVGVNTSYPNRLIWEAYETGLFPHWKGFSGGQAEAKINAKSRMDLVLWKDELPGSLKYSAEVLTHQDCPKLHFVEVKNVSLAVGETALFPDAVTARGQKHILELMELMKRGHSAEFVFIVQREDCKSFSPADEIDPEYGRLLRQAQDLGLRLSAYSCQFSETELKLKPEGLKVLL